MSNTVFVTKYWNTIGIVEKEVNKIVGKYCYVKWEGGLMGTMQTVGLGREWHPTLESALKRVETNRLEKIASLEKQIEKLKNFEPKICRP